MESRAFGLTASRLRPNPSVPSAPMWGWRDACLRSRGPPNFPLTQVRLWPTLALVNTSDLLTADQAATAAGVNRRTITKWADTGRLPVAMKLPGNTGARLFRRSDVEALTTEATT